VPTIAFDGQSHTVRCYQTARSYTQLCASADAKPSAEGSAQISVNMTHRTNAAAEIPASMVQYSDDKFPSFYQLFCTILYLSIILGSPPGVYR
jgi:hypothetical protein